MGSQGKRCWATCSWAAEPRTSEDTWLEPLNLSSLLPQHTPSWEGGVCVHNATTVRQLRMQWCSAQMCQNRTMLGDELMTFQKQLWTPLKTLPSKAWFAASCWADTDILLLFLLRMLPGFGLNIHEHLVTGRGGRAAIGWEVAASSVGMELTTFMLTNTEVQRTVT